MLIIKSSSLSYYFALCIFFNLINLWVNNVKMSSSEHFNILIWKQSNSRTFRCQSIFTWSVCPSRTLYIVHIGVLVESGNTKTCRIHVWHIPSESACKCLAHGCLRYFEVCIIGRILYSDMLGWMVVETLYKIYCLIGNNHTLTIILTRY